MASLLAADLWLSMISDERLRCVLDRLQTAKAVVNFDEIILRQTEVNFNGHRIIQNGLLPLESHVNNNNKNLVFSKEKRN